jgi:hypothetical protein
MCGGESLQLFQHIEILRRENGGGALRLDGKPGAGLRCIAPPVFPGEKPAGQRFDPQGPGGPHGFRHLPGSKIETAHVTDLPLLHQMIHGVQGFLQRREGVVVVDLVQVEVIRLEFLQTAVNVLQDVLT